MKKRVIIYSTPSCVYCQMVKDFFLRNDIHYMEYNVLENEEAREEMVKKSHQMGVPVIDIDGEIHVGFNRSELSKALDL